MPTVTVPADLLFRLAVAAAGRNETRDDGDIITAFRAVHRQQPEVFWAEARWLDGPLAGVVEYFGGR